MFKRAEVSFEIDHRQTGTTPRRPDVRKAVAAALKTDEKLVFVRKFETRTGTRVARGTANVYKNADQARLVEPAYIMKRNVPEVEKPKEEPAKPQEKKEEVKSENVKES